MKDEAVAIRPKRYLILEKKYQEGQGGKKNVVEKEIRRQQYKETLFEREKKSNFGTG